MKVDINLAKDFERYFNVLNETYGEDFAEINGLSEEKLSFTDFINNFSKKKTVADASVDGSSNVKNKDIVTLRSEMGKPHEKLLAYNKIFLEMKQIFGLRKAKKWMELEWNKALYLHDANTATFVPYCYLGEETLCVKYKGNIYNVSMKNLYELIEEPPTYDITVDEYVKFPQDLYVQDIIDGEKVFSTKIERILSHHNTRPMRFIKTSNGLSCIVTDNHPMITSEGEVEAKDLEVGSCLYTINANNIFDNSVSSVELYVKTQGKKVADCNVEFELDKELGWLTGMYLSDGSGCDYISQKSTNAQFDRIVNIMNSHGISHVANPADNRIYFKACPYVYWLRQVFGKQTASQKALPADYIHWSYDFLDGIVAGLIDGDGTIGGAGRNVFIRIASRELLNQIQSYIATKDTYVGQKIPVVAYKESHIQPHLTQYGITFPITNCEYFSGIGSIKIKNKYVPRKRKGNFANHRYSTDYGWSEVIENVEFIDMCDTVYDITTSTGHFVCNNILSHNCFAYDLTKLAEEGLFYLDHHDKPEPAKHLETFVDFVKEFINFTSNRTSGACGLPNLLPYMYYFWKKDIDSGHYPRCQDEETFAKSQIQRIIYGMNQPYTRDGIQSAFVNTSIFDSQYFDALFGGGIFPNGEFMIDHKEGILQFEKWFLEEMAAIKDRGRMFTFPVNSISLLKTDGKFVDEEFARWCSNHNRRWNDSNIFADKDVTSLSNCCRLKSNIKDLGYFNSIGGSALKVGSVKVSTINLARIAYECDGSEKKFLNILKDRLIINMEMLHVIRHIIQRNVEKNLLPNFQEGIIDFEHLYNTVGINGIYEVMKTFGYIEVDEFGYTKYLDKAMEFGKAIFDTIHATIKEFAADKDYMVNVEQIPGETAALRFMQADKLLYPNKTTLVTYRKPAYRFAIDGTTYLIPKNTQLKLINDNNVITIEDFLNDTENKYEIDDTCLEEFIVIKSDDNK